MIYVILGPTASHKSKLAYEMSTLLFSDIINFDAFQVYKELNIGSAKPTKEELKDPRFKLYDFVSVTEEFDIKKYQELARNILKEEGNHILIGGTGLYLKATLFDYNFLEEEKMDPNFLSEYSNEELYEKLFKLDSEDALKIGKNNRKRLVRALYIYSVHGKTKNELNCNGKDSLLYENVVFIGLNPPREELYDNINKRVDTMFNSGLEEEVRYLFSKYDCNLKAFQAIGYKEFLNSDLNSGEIKELIKKNTRNYAKRQITFFKHQFTNVIYFSNYLDAFNYVKEKYGNY